MRAPTMLALARLAAARLAARDDAPAAPPGSLALPADATAPWVLVDDEGQPARTVTPRLSSVGGAPTVVDGAPHDLTASVFTWTSWGRVSTSSGPPPNPTATRPPPSPEGAFSRCFNRAGPDAPFCRPLRGSTLETGRVYYVTWDPDFYNRSANASLDVAVRLDYLDPASGDMLKLDTLDRVPAHWGFCPLHLDDALLKGLNPNNVTISLLASLPGSADKNRSAALPVAFARPALGNMDPPHMPRPVTLAVAIPLSLAAVLLLVVGLCLWNGQTRRIGLGNVMGRARRGYSGRRARRRRLRNKDPHAIQLVETPLDPRPEGAPESPLDDPPPADYRDVPSPDAPGPSCPGPDAAFEQQGTRGTARNAFRDEVDRQERERRGDAS